MLPAKPDFSPNQFFLYVLAVLLKPDRRNLFILGQTDTAYIEYYTRINWYGLVYTSFASSLFFVEISKYIIKIKPIISTAKLVQTSVFSVGCTILS